MYYSTRNIRKAPTVNQSFVGIASRQSSTVAHYIEYLGQNSSPPKPLDKTPKHQNSSSQPHCFVRTATHQIKYHENMMIDDDDDDDEKQ